MTDLRDRMRIYNQVPAPDYWSEVEVRASNASAGAAQPARSARPILLLVAALLTILAISAAVAIGSGLVELPAILPAPLPAPSDQASAAPSPSVEGSPADDPWITGRELMDVLSDDFGYAWSEQLGGNGQSSFSSANPASNPPTAIQVLHPVDFAAQVGITASVDVAESAFPHVDRVAQLLAPNEAAWIANAVDQALASVGPYSSATWTTTGGYVKVTRVDEVDLTDWVSVWFSPLADGMVTDWCGGYLAPSARLRCISAENNSAADMALLDDGGAARIEACRGMAQSGPNPTGPWSLQVGRADPELAIVGPVLASFDSSQLSGQPPYFIEVVINPDLTATIRQRASLSGAPTVSPNC